MTFAISYDVLRQPTKPRLVVMLEGVGGSRLLAITVVADNNLTDDNYRDWRG